MIKYIRHAGMLFWSCSFSVICCGYCNRIFYKLQFVLWVPEHNHNLSLTLTKLFSCQNIRIVHYVLCAHNPPQASTCNFSATAEKNGKWKQECVGLSYASNLTLLWRVSSTYASHSLSWQTYLWYRTYIESKAKPCIKKNTSKFLQHRQESKSAFTTEVAPLYCNRQYTETTRGIFQHFKCMLLKFTVVQGCNIQHAWMHTITWCYVDVELLV